MSVAKEVAEKKLQALERAENKKNEFVSKHLMKVHQKILEHGEVELYEKLEPRSQTFKGMMSGKLVHVTVNPNPSNIPVYVIGMSPLVSIEIKLEYKPKTGQGIYGPECLYSPGLDRGLREYFENPEKIDPIDFIKSRSHDMVDGKVKRVRLIQDKDGYFFETDGVKFMYLSLKDPDKISIYLTKGVYQNEGLIGIVDDILNNGLALQKFEDLKLVD